MIDNVSVREVMSKNPITLHPKETIDKANLLFKEMDIHHIPLVVMNKVVGILSLGDLLCIDSLKNRNLDKHFSNKIIGVSTLDDIMTPNPICINDSSTLELAIETMIENRINCLPIIDDENEIVGLITTHDINKFLLKELKNQIA